MTKLSWPLIVAAFCLALTSPAWSEYSGPPLSPHKVNIIDGYGATPDTLRLTCNVTTTSGQTALTIAGCKNYVTAASVASPLSSFNQGKNIIIDGDGASLGTAPIVAQSGLTKGSGYLDVPTITVSDATGSGALLLANMELNTPTLIHGGVACTTGTQTFTLSGGTLTPSIALTTISLASPGVLTFPGDAPPNGTAITLSTTGALPTGLTAGTTYFIGSSSGSTAQLSATSGGSAINTSGSQSGTQTLNFSPASFSGTVSGGVLSGALTVVTPGSYVALRTPGSVLNPQSIATTGGGCTSPVMVSATFDVGSITRYAGGQNYTAPTATFSGGNAALSTLTIGTPVAAPLATTIATVTDATDATLSVAAGQTLAAANVYVVLGGTDNQTAIQNAITANGSPSSLGGSDIFVPPAQRGYCYGVGSSITLPNRSWGRLYGVAGKLSDICGIASFTGLITNGDIFTGTGWMFDGLILDGNKVVNKIYSGGCDTKQFWSKVELWNAAPYGINMQVGDNDGCAGGHYYSVYTYNDSSIYNAHYDAPLIGKHIQNTDTYFVGSEDIGDSLYGTSLDVGSAGAHLVNPHNFNPDSVTTCYDITTIVNILTSPECDNPAVSAINIHNSRNQVSGGFINTGKSIPWFGIEVDDGKTFTNLTSFDADTVMLPQNRVLFLGTIGKYNKSDNPGAWPKFGDKMPTVLCEGIGSFTTAASSEITLADCPIPNGIIGLYGSLTVKSAFTLTGASTTGTNFWYRYGAATTAFASWQSLGTASKSIAGWAGMFMNETTQNKGSVSSQYSGNILGTSGGVTVAPLVSNWNTGSTTDLVIDADAAATDTVTLNWYSVVLQPANDQ